MLTGNEGNTHPGLHGLFYKLNFFCCRPASALNHTDDFDAVVFSISTISRHMARHPSYFC